MRMHTVAMNSKNVIKNSLTFKVYFGSFLGCCDTRIVHNSSFKKYAEQMVHFRSLCNGQWEEDNH